MAVFVRFAGCNLRCSYCDTAYSWNVKDAAEVLNLAELLDRIHSYPWKKVTLTGRRAFAPAPGGAVRHPQPGRVRGEYRDQWLRAPAAEAACRTVLYYGREIPVLRRPGKDADGQPVPAERRRRGEVRGGQPGRLGGYGQGTGTVPLYRQSVPVPGVWEIEPKELVEFVREHKLANVCVQVQLHKVIWDPAMRGV